MDVYATEAEQIAQLKRWAKEYIPGIVLGISLVLIFTFGWQYWQKRQLQFRVAASVAYESLLQHADNEAHDKWQGRAQAVMDTYENTPYSILAALLSARGYVQDGKLEKAAQRLHWAEMHSHDAAMKQISRLRLARVTAAQGKFNEALTLLDTPQVDAFTTAVEGVKGDILIAMGEKEKAKQAYAAALKAVPKKEMSRPLLEMKYHDLSGTALPPITLGTATTIKGEK